MDVYDSDDRDPLTWRNGLASEILLFTAGLYLNSRAGQLTQMLHREYGSRVICMHPEGERIRQGMEVDVFRKPHYKNYLWLWRLVRRERIKVVWVYNLPPLPHAILASLFSGAAVVMNFAGGDIQYSKELRWGYRHTVIGNLVFHTLMRFPKRFVCMSPFTRELALEAGINEQKLVTIPNMFEIDQEWQLSTNEETSALRQELALQGRRVIICVARHSPEKRIADLIASIVAIRDKYPDVILLSIGEGDLLQKHKDLALELGVAENVRFVTDVPRKCLRLYYALAEVSCNISDSDAFCNPVIEALTQGTPIVVSHGVGAGRYLHGQPYCKFADPERSEVALRILELLDGAVKHTHSIDAITKAREFDVSAVFPLWRRLFDDLLSGER